MCSCVEQVSYKTFENEDSLRMLVWEKTQCKSFENFLSLVHVKVTGSLGKLEDK